MPTGKRSGVQTADSVNKEELLRLQALAIPEITVTRNGIIIEGLTNKVIGLARAYGWLVHHQRPARTGRGWRTAIQGDAGFPDLVLARGHRLIFAELKSQRGELSAGQKNWMVTLGDEDWPETTVWRPSDLLSGAIEEVLK